MSTRAKFRVSSVTAEEGGRQNPETRQWEAAEMRTIKLSPVYGHSDPNHENTKFWQATPSGEISLGTVNITAAEQFTLGTEFYVDFTVAPIPEHS